MRTPNYNFTIRAQDSIAQGALTNSKRPECFVKGVYQTHAKGGRGPFIFDAEGRKLYDFICGLGSCILGYGNVKIADAIYTQAIHGASLSMPSILELELAEKIKEVVPWAQKMRFLKTGTEACMAAIRIARAYQGVTHENEKMYSLLGNKEFTRISQRSIQDGWPSMPLQEVRKELSILGKSDGNQATCSEKLFANSEGQECGTETLSQEVGAGEGIGQGQDLFGGSLQSESDALSDLWVSSFAGTSSRLHSSARRDMVMSAASRRGSPRVLILSEGYHGHADDFIGLVCPHLGVVADPYTLPLHGNEDLIPIAAAVIVEPVMTDLSEARIQWLRDLRDRCTQMGALLIFDEVITGFRTPKFTMSNYLGIEPDIICLGKAIANGMPLSVVAGKDDVMNCGEYFVSSTFAGEKCSIAAGLKCIELLQTQFKIDGLWLAGEHFISEFNKLYPEKIKIEGYPTRGVFVGDPLVKALLWQEAYLGGILFGSSWFINFAHIAHIERVLNILQDIMMRIKTGSVTLKGEMPKSPFSQQQREKKP